MNYLTRENRTRPIAFPVAGTLVLWFGLLCAILAAIGGVFFFNLRSIENLNGVERSSDAEIAVLQRVGTNVASRQIEVFRHLAAPNPEEKERHEQVIARLVEANTKTLTDYESSADAEAEKRLYTEVLQARKAYSERTEHLLALSRAQRNAETTTFALTTQVPAYDQYQLQLDALLRFEEAEGRGLAASTTGRIAQTRILGDLLIGFAIVIAVGTGIAVLRMVGTLRQDKRSLQTEVKQHQRSEEALREGEARYRLLVDHSPDTILVVCEEKIVFANPAAVKLLGADRSDQLIGRSVSKLVHPDELAEVARRGKEVAEGKHPPATERRLLRLDGSAIEVESRVISFLYEGKPALQVIARDNTERAKAERKVRESEANLALAQRVAEVGSWEYQFTADGQVDAGKLLCSQEAYRIFGRPSDAPHLSIEAFYGALHPDDRAFIAGCFQALRDRNEPFDYDYRIIRPDGAVRIIHSVADTIFDPDTGKRSKVVGTVFDITERRATERQLREAEEKYRAIFDNASEGIFQSTPSGVLLSANPALARMMGFESPDEFIRERSAVEQQIYAKPAERQEIKRLLDENGTLSNFEYEVKRKDGSTIWISENARVVRDVSGSGHYYEGSMQDITERKAAEESLRESEQKFHQLADNITDVFWITSPDLKTMHYVSGGYELIWGRSKASLYANPHQWIETILQDDRERVSAVFGTLMANAPLVSVEYRMARPDGTIRWIHDRGFQVRDEAGKLVRLTGIASDITERKRAEDILAESERRLRFLNDLGDVTRSLSQPKEIMATVARLLGTHLHVSRCAYAEVQKDGDRFTVPGDYIDGCPSIVGEYRLSDFGAHTHSQLTAGRTVVLRDVDAELTPEDGAATFSSVQIKAMIACPLIKNGELVAAMAVHHLAPRQWTNSEIALVQDVVERCWSIIERARAELVLRESEEYLRLVITASNDGIWEYDFVTDALTWSDRVYDMFGLDRSSFIPTLDSFTALLHPDDRAIFKKMVPEQMASGTRYEAHVRILRQDGSYGHFLRRGRAVLDAEGNPTRLVGSFADLTSLFQAEQKLVEQANLLNLAQDAIMVRNMDDRIEFWNHGAEVLYGWTAAEARGQPSCDFLHYEEPVKILAERTLLETGAWSGECRHLTRQGNTVIVRSRWTLVRDEHGQPKSKLVIATDLTEQKKIEEQFLRAQRLESIGTLASGVAHDLNNILVPIMMAAPVLRGKMDPAEREKFLDIVEASAQRGADIIKQVLTFARGADGDHTLLQPIYLLEEVSKIVSQTFPKSIAVRTCYDENIRSLEADPTQLHQVLLNLCINARDAMPNGGELCLGVENFEVDEHYASVTPGATAGPHVMLQVTDSGSGIPKDVIAKIYDPFFTTKSIGHGTGLGLSTVAGIVKSHGGFIHVYSEPGHTSFKVFLPAQATLDTSVALPVDAMVPRGNGETVLLVDDEPSIRELAAIILTSYGYKVLVAEDGPTALALFAQHLGHIAVAVTDLAMPGMSGLMLVRTLRQIEPALKVIVSTGRADDTHAAEITSLHVDGCLTKPYTTRNLLLKLSHVLHSGLQDAA